MYAPVRCFAELPRQPLEQPAPRDTFAPMTTTQAERIDRARYDLRQLQPGHRPNHAPSAPTEAPRDPSDPIAHLDAPDLDELTQNLLEDWDNPVFTPLGLCRAHRISLDQLQAIAATPRFIDALARIRAIQQARQPAIEARARELALDRLCTLADQSPTSATHTKEIRLSIKQLLAILTQSHPTPNPTSPDRKGGDGFDAQQHEPPTTHANQSQTPPDRKGGDGFDAQQHEPATTDSNKPQALPDGKEGDGSHADPTDASTHAGDPHDPNPRTKRPPRASRTGPSPVLISAINAAGAPRSALQAPAAPSRPATAPASR